MCTKSHVQRSIVDIIWDSYEPYQSFSSVALHNRTVNVAGEHHWSARREADKSSFFLQPCITTEAITNAKKQHAGITGRLHSHLKMRLHGDLEALPYDCLPLYASFISPTIYSMCSDYKKNWPCSRVGNDWSIVDCISSSTKSINIRQKLARRETVS